MLAAYLPGEVVASAWSVLAAAVVSLGLLISRLRERVAKLEEWQRLAERRDDHEHDDEDR